MDVQKYLVLIFFAQLDNCWSAVFFSGTKNDTFQDSQQYCKSVGGTLLTYGELLIKTVRKCTIFGDEPQLWTETPWYNRDLGCYSGQANQVLSGVVEDKHLAVCADFCSNNNFDRIGLWTSKCECYDSSVNLVYRACSPVNCPLNPSDKCGVGNYGIVFRKVFSSDVCRYRTFKISGEIIENPNPCSEKKQYVCRVGDTDDLISCSFDNAPSKSEPLTSSTNGIIIGVVVGGVALVIIIVLIVIFVRFRGRASSAQQETEQQLRDLSDNEQGTFHYRNSQGQVRDYSNNNRHDPSRARLAWTHFKERYSIKSTKSTQNDATQTPAAEIHNIENTEGSHVEYPQASTKNNQRKNYSNGISYTNDKDNCDLDFMYSSITNDGRALDCEFQKPAGISKYSNGTTKF